MIKSKICPICKMEKLAKGFYQCKVRKDGLSSYCRKCLSIYSKDYYNKNQHTIQKRTRDRYRNNESVRQHVKLKTLKTRYGLTPDDYNKIFEKQNNCCAICGKHQKDISRILFIDHCHKTGKIRGLLCIDCNTALGYFRDNITTLKRAINYLETRS